MHPFWRGRSFLHFTTSPYFIKECLLNMNLRMFSPSVMQIVARLSWPTARLGPAVSSPRTTVNITLVFSNLTNTELDSHPPVLFQHVCPFVFYKRVYRQLVSMARKCFLSQEDIFFNTKKILLGQDNVFLLTIWRYTLISYV